MPGIFFISSFSVPVNLPYAFGMSFSITNQFMKYHIIIYLAE